MPMGIRLKCYLPNVVMKVVKRAHNILVQGAADRILQPHQVLKPIGNRLDGGLCILDYAT